MPAVNRRQLLRLMDDPKLPFPDRVARMMTYQAALHAATGKPLKEMDTEDEVETEELDKYAKKLWDLGIGNYAKRAYAGEDPAKVDMKALKYEYFLYQAVDRLGMPGALQQFAVKDTLRGKLKGWERKGKIPCQDHWLHQWSEQEEARKTPLKEEDRPVYEYTAPDDVWKDYAAGTYYEKKWGARPLDAETVNKFKSNAIDQLTLRNKRTVEQVKRGDMKAVSASRLSVRKSFTFLRPQDLMAAQASARTLHEQMRACTGDVTRTQEWQKLMSAVEKFQAAKSSGAAAHASADVLLAVEKFTKGKKNASQSPEVSRCVNLALQSLGTTIPDAARNPSVKPLIDRFNEVRRHRLQFGSMVNLEGNKALSMNATDQEILEPWDRQVRDFIDRNLTGTTESTEIYGAEPIGEADAREHIAIALALEEGREGKLNIRKDLHGRISELIQDPTVKELARGMSADPEKQELARMNAPIFGPYVKEKYEQLLQEKEEREKQRRMEKENSFRKDLVRRGSALGEELAEMGARFYDPEEGVEYDPEKARDIFAEALALQEAGARKEPVEDPQGELNKRIEELKKDPAVAKMARDLPSDPDFRRILERSQRKNESPLKTASEALSKAYANGGELPEELRGHTISDLYAARRQDVKRLAGVQPGAMDLNADESILVLAHLMAIRELELKSGSKDAKVDENAFDKRVEELSGDPYIRNLGAGLTVPKNKQILKKPAEEKDEPEKFFAIDLYRSYQKNLEKQKNIKKPEQAPEEPEEEIKQNEIKQTGEGVPVV